MYMYVYSCMSMYAVQLLNKMPLLLTHQMKYDLGQVIQVCLSHDTICSKCTCIVDKYMYMYGKGCVHRACDDE